MIARIIRECGANPVMTILVTTVLVVLTAASLPRVSLDALPDLTDTQIIIAADWHGRSPDLIENQVTYPIVTSLLGSPQVKYVRGVSMLGMSQVVVVFEDGTDLYWARARVTEKIAGLTGLPQGVTPQLGPEATGVGWVYQYALIDRTGQHDLAQLRSIQDWQLRFALQAVPGVAEVAAVGGFIKQFEVRLDPVKLQAYGIAPLDVARAVRGGNMEVGPGVLEMAGTAFTLRGKGYIEDLDDLRRIPVRTSAGAETIHIGDIGHVQLSPAPRVGAAELNGEGEAVGGIVVMRMGENALTVIERVKERLESLKSSLPPGVEIVSVYDREPLIYRTIETLRNVVIEEIILVGIIVSIFLWHTRSSIIAILPLPISVLLSFLPMMFSGLTVNIMSLGGIALAIGAMVDSGIILVENAHKRLEGLDTAKIADSERRRIILDAFAEVGRPLFFSLLVITVSFLPVFALEGREGRLFTPLAFTKTVSMMWAAIVAITLAPALAVLFLRGKFVREEDHPISRRLHSIYGPMVDFVVKQRVPVVIAGLVVTLISLPLFYRGIQTEFMPPLNEGSILYMPTAVPGMSIDTAVEIMQKQNRMIRELPEVASVFGKAGRANTPTDPAPINMFETVIELKPRKEWREDMTYEAIVAELDRKLDFPGMPNIWWMPIQTRVEMISTGVRTAVGAKILASNVADAEKAALAIEEALRGLPETRSAFAERMGSAPYIDIEIDRDAAATFGLNLSDIYGVVETALAGTEASVAVQGRERYGIVVRYAPDFRNDLAAINDILIPTPAGGVVSLEQIARVGPSSGPPMIASENGRILSFVFIDTQRDLGLGEYIKKAKEVVARDVVLPAGVQVTWSGQFEAMESAKKTLIFIVPITILLIVLLLYWSTRSLVETFIVLLAVPFSLIGAFGLIWMLDYKLSVATWVGIIALAGIDAEMGVIMLLYLTRAYDKRILAGETPSWSMLQNAIHEGAVQRVRPKLMTVTATFIGLLPVMWSTGTGSEVMKRIAAPMVGGVFTSAILELLIYPAIFAIWKNHEHKKLQTSL